MIRIPDTARKVYIFGGFGLVIGAGIGGYLSFKFGNYFYAGFGAAIGYILSAIFCFLFCKRLSLQRLVSIERKMNILFGVMGLLLAVAGIYVFISKGAIVGIFAALFFGTGGFYLLLRKRDKLEE